MNAEEAPKRAEDRTEAAMSLQDVDLNLLLVLRELLEQRSVSRAAEQLGRTQSAVSHSLARLRETFGDPLFVRAGRGLEATPFAESLVEPVESCLGSLSSLFFSRGDFDPALLERRFVIVAADYGEMVVLDPLVHQLRKLAPGVDLEVRFAGDDVDREVQAGRVDLAIGANFRDFPGLYFRRLDDDELAVVSAKRPGPRRPWSLKHYVAADHILVSPRGRSGSMVDSLLATLGHSRRVVFVTPHFLVAMHLASRGRGVVTAPRSLARSLAEALDLDVRRPPFEPPRFSLGILYREASRFDPAHAWLRDLISTVATANHARNRYGS
jgi:DNA-binding transcriptional LysR family regulator